mmetsp:Transcript_58199/g.189689  ORF Transcript_58199/g.189689 Transcript_58199/m.189689 type:complete len:200 (-) Transcript_58199:370-969(-)
MAHLNGNLQRFQQSLGSALPSPQHGPPLPEHRHVGARGRPREHRAGGRRMPQVHVHDRLVAGVPSLEQVLHRLHFVRHEDDKTNSHLSFSGKLHVHRRLCKLIPGNSAGGTCRCVGLRRSPHWWDEGPRAEHVEEHVTIAVDGRPHTCAERGTRRKPRRHALEQGRQIPRCIRLQTALDLPPNPASIGPQAPSRTQDGR